MIHQSVSLSFQEGASDKVYNAQILKEHQGYLVSFSYGRRGSSLKTGNKTPSPVPLEQAQKTFNKLVKSKVSKGYIENGKSPIQFQADCDKQHSNISCQLLNLISHEEAITLCSKPRFCLQEKFDGERRLIEKQGDSVKGINRKGFYLPLAETIESLFKTDDAFSFIVDGEDLGDNIVLFDILELNGQDLKGKSYAERYRILSQLGKLNPQFTIAKSVSKPREKLDFLTQLDRAGKEGGVFKDLSAPYTSGRPNSGGTQLKRKFVKDCSVIVSVRNPSRRSVGLAVVDVDGNRIAVGNVTIPPNKAVPPVGTVINVRYLYAYKKGSLYQPVYDRPRTDLEHSDCLINQLQYKAAS